MMEGKSPPVQLIVVEAPVAVSVEPALSDSCGVTFQRWVCPAPTVDAAVSFANASRHQSSATEVTFTVAAEALATARVASV